jgi:uncharacterized protein YciI
MPRYIALFRDNPDAGWVREKHDKDHFDYLAKNTDRIVIAGGLRPDWGEFWNGGLWVLEVANKEEAAQLAEADPYFRLGLRASYEILGWGKAPCYGDIKL